MPHDDSHGAEDDEGGAEGRHLSRRTVMKGVGGLAALSLSGATAEDARAAIAGDAGSDPHTLDTYRSVVDAIVPRTPDLEADLGAAYVAGGLDVGLERFLVWDFDHFQEVRLETLTSKPPASAPQGTVSRDRYELDLDTTGPGSDLQALTELAGSSVSLSDFGGLDTTLDFGAIERLRIAFADTTADTGPAPFNVRVETADEVVHRVVQNYPYAPGMALVFDVVAASFLARGENHDPPTIPQRRFPAGGTFVRLSPHDRLRCLWTIVDGGAIDRLDTLLSPLVPTLGILKYVVMAVNGLNGLGYYSEWAGYGSTKDDMPEQRSLQTSAADVQGHRQSGYPGPAPGYAADWRHAIPGGFADPDVEHLDLPADLKGQDVIEGGGSS